MRVPTLGCGLLDKENKQFMSKKGQNSEQKNAF